MKFKFGWKVLDELVWGKRLAAVPAKFTNQTLN